jgi:hypothetical protein
MTRGSRSSLWLTLFACLSLGCNDLIIAYSHHQNLQSLDWAMKWYAEDTAGVLAGPFDSGGTGYVHVGPLADGPVHVTYSVLPAFVFTQMDTPLRLVHYYTGDPSPANGNVTVALDNAVIGQELLLFYPFVSWWTLDANPWSLTQSFGGQDVVDDDGNVSVFVSVRADANEEPASRYDFQLDLDPAALSDVRFDASSLRTRAPMRQWQSSADLSNDDMYLMARRKGVHLIAGEASFDSPGMSGEFGVPSDFPAELWYLVSGDVVSDIVQQFDPAGNGPIAMEPLAGWIDDDTMAFDAAERRFSVSAPGLGNVQFGLLRLAHAGGYWEVCFPGTRLERNGDVVSLTLPQYPPGVLPTFSSLHLDLYRLDGEADFVDMLRFKWHPRAHALPSHALLTGFEFL